MVKTNEPGYVYILTNPSFREDWVKIGKSARPVDIRSKELDNTADGFAYSSESGVFQCAAANSFGYIQ